MTVCQNENNFCQNCDLLFLFFRKCWSCEIDCTRINNVCLPPSPPVSTTVKPSDPSIIQIEKKFLNHFWDPVHQSLFWLTRICLRRIFVFIPCSTCRNTSSWTTSFTPIFRIHGGGSNIEIWNYGDDVQKWFMTTDNLRYRLLPYVYSLAWKVQRIDFWKPFIFSWAANSFVIFKAYRFGYTFQRGLIFVFANDMNVFQIGDEFMFGPAFLVCPVLILNATSREAYVPKVDGGWYTFWDAKPVTQTGCVNNEDIVFRCDIVFGCDFCTTTQNEDKLNFICIFWLSEKSHWMLQWIKFLCLFELDRLYH